MTTLIIISSIVFGLIVAYYNAFVFKMYFSRAKKDNNIVHRLGGALRLFWIVAVIAFCWFSKLPWYNVVFFTLVNITLAWTLFDFVYNQIHNHRWYYSGTISSGTSSVLDKLLNRFDEWIKLALLLLTILWHPFYVYEILEDTILNRGWDLLIAIVIFGGFGYLAYRFFNKKEKN